MTALTSVRRRRTAAALVGGLLVAAVLVTLGYVGVDTLRNSKEGRPADTRPPGRTLPPTPAALLAVRGDDGALTSLVVLALAPPGEDGVARGGTIIPLPVGAGLEAGADARRIRMADNYAKGGLTQLADEVASLLAVNFSLVSEVDRSGLVALLQPVGQVQVELATDVVTSGPGAVEQVLFTAGAQKLDPKGAAALMLAANANDPESVRLENIAAYWSGVQSRVGAGLTRVDRGPTSDSDVLSMGSFLRSVLAGPTRVYTLRGEPISRGPENPDGLDMYRLNSAEVIRVMATVLPDAISPVDVLFTVQIVNPTGDSSLTQAAVDRLALAGVGIVLIRELSGASVPDVTELSLGGRADIVDLQPYADALGETVVVPLGAPGTPHGRVFGIDATFVLGESFHDLVERQSATTVPVAKTTTPTPSTTPATTSSSSTTSVPGMPSTTVTS